MHPFRFLTDFLKFLKMHKKRVLIYSDCDFFAGCENIVNILLKSKKLNNKYDLNFFYRFSSEYYYGLKKRGLLELSQISGTFNISNKHTPKNLFIRILKRLLILFTGPLFFIYNSIVLLVMLLRIKPDIILINNGGFPGSLNCLILSKLSGFYTNAKKKIMIINNQIDKNNYIYKIFPYFLKDSLKSLDYIVSGSEHTLSDYHFKGSSFRYKLKAIPNGISTDRFAISDISNRRKKIYQESSILCFGIVGIFEKRKGHAVLIDAAKKILDFDKNLKFKLFIEGKTDVNLKNMSISYGLNDFIDFIDAGDNISSFYSKTDILVVPSLSNEDMPNVITEAMSFGIPTIGSNIAGIPRQISSGYNGYLCKPGDTENLSKIMIKFIHNPEALNSMSLNCVESYNKDFTPNVCSDEYEKIFEQ